MQLQQYDLDTIHFLIFFSFKRQEFKLLQKYSS
jgi:hypothetical protein